MYVLESVNLVVSESVHRCSSLLSTLLCSGEVRNKGAQHILHIESVKDRASHCNMSLVSVAESKFPSPLRFGPTMAAAAGQNTERGGDRTREGERESERAISSLG